MYKNKTICVIIPAFNEETLIIPTLLGIPDYVDRIIVVDDASTDNSAFLINNFLKTTKEKARFKYIRHDFNRGVGAAVKSGYIEAKSDKNIDIAAVMAGDGQMNPNELQALLDEIINNNVNYAKGNRLHSFEALKKIPLPRLIGNTVLSAMTRITSGYWDLQDSQSGFTAMDRTAIETINLNEIFDGYGMPNDLLAILNTHDLTISNVPITPIYNIGENSGIRIPAIIAPMLIVLSRSWLKRIYNKYLRV